MTAPPASASRARLPGLDHLRALAIVAVFFYHYRLFAEQRTIAAAGAFGWSGVDLFFVLSGFLIGSQLLAPMARGAPLRPGEFYAKRLFRTLPPYLATLALYFAVPAFIDRSALPPLWKFVTFTQNLALEPPRALAFSHAWSLCVEEQFYLVLPALSFLIFRLGRPRAGAWLLALLFAGGALLRWLLWPGPDQTPAWYRLIYYPTWSRLDGLVVGVAIAALFVFRPELLSRVTARANLLLAAGLGLLCGAAWLCAEQQELAPSVLGFPLIAIGFGAWVLSALGPRGLLHRFDSRVTRYLAAISYSLYLTHKSIVHLTLRALEGHLDRTGVAAFAVCFVAAILFASLMHFSIERPSLQLRDRWLQARSLALR